MYTLQRMPRRFRAALPVLGLLALGCASPERATDLPDSWTPPSGPQAEELSAIAQATRDKLPPEALAVIDETNVKLAESSALARALKTGQVAPDFALPDANGNSVSLAKLLREGPVVLTFYRGHW